MTGAGFVNGRIVYDSNRVSYNLLVFKAINFSQSLYLSALIRSRSLTRINRLLFTQLAPRGTKVGVALQSPHQLNGTDHHNLSDPNRKLIVSEASSILTCLDWHTPHLSHVLTWAFWILKHVSLRTIPSWN